MAVAVIGGTGGLGAHVVTELVERGHEVRIVSRRVLEAEVRAGVPHHVEISVVGCDRIPMGYYNAEYHTLGERSATWRAHDGRTRLPLRIPLPGKAGRALRDGAACLGEQSRPGWIGFDERLNAHTGEDVSL